MLRNLLAAFAAALFLAAAGAPAIAHCVKLGALH